EDGRVGRPDVHVEAPREHDEHVLVLRPGREEELARREVAALAAAQQLLDVRGLDAVKQLEPGEQRALVIRIDGWRRPRHGGFPGAGSKAAGAAAAGAPALAKATPSPDAPTRCLCYMRCLR